MAKIQLMTDSGCDISYENEHAYGIQVLPFRLTMGSKEYVSRKDFNNEQFYELMDAYDGIPLTSQITPFEFLTCFEEHYQNGYTDVINISINSEGSGTHGNALLAEQDFYESHPEAKETFTIYNIDAGTYSGCYGYAVVEAAKMIKEGKEAPEVAAFVQGWLKDVAAYFVPYTLKYAAKSGRLPNIARYVGDVLGIKPLMLLFDHKITVAGKVRSEKNIIPQLAKRVTEEMKTGEPYFVIYGNDSQAKENMVEAMTKTLSYPPADCYQLGAAVTANAGPRVVGVVFQKKRG